MHNKHVRTARDRARPLLPMSGLRCWEAASVPRYVIVLSGDPDPFEHTRTTLRSDTRFTDARAGLSTPWT